jgi:hypothetical protein
LNTFDRVREFLKHPIRSCSIRNIGQAGIVDISLLQPAELSNNLVRRFGVVPNGGGGSGKGRLEAAISTSVGATVGAGVPHAFTYFAVVSPGFRVFLFWTTVICITAVTILLHHQ